MKGIIVPMERRQFLRTSTAAFLIAGAGLQSRADTDIETSPPATFPPEAEAVSGRHSLRAHAHKHGLLTGAAVVVHALQNAFLFR